MRSQLLGSAFEEKCPGCTASPEASPPPAAGETRAFVSKRHNNRTACCFGRAVRVSSLDSRGVTQRGRASGVLPLFPRWYHARGNVAVD